MGRTFIEMNCQKLLHANDDVGYRTQQETQATFKQNMIS